MTSDLASLRTEAASAIRVRIPEERVVAMIGACAAEVRRVTAIEDAKEVTSIAEAIAAVTRKLNVAKEVKIAGIRLVVEAEAKLGEILGLIPKGARGRKTPAGSVGKNALLAKHGINKRRASFAERLSKVPPKKIEAVLASGASSMNAVTTGLELHSDSYALRQKSAEALAFLCGEAVDLLRRSVRDGKVPHAGTVAEMVTRYQRIQAHGNRRLAP